MRCPSCGTEAIPGKKFCHACGARLEARCPNCGTAVDPSFRFCPDCGFRLTAEGATPAAPAPPEVDPDGRLARFSRHIPEGLATKILAAKGSISGERKLVTVLFCDLVGSTAIAERLDPEEYHDLLEQYLELAFREIYRFEGIVNQLAGDGMMSLFGAPIAHEDAPQRAVRAALAIRDALATFNEASRAAGRPELHARIGVHTGPVVVGTVGNDLKMDYTAIGDTTNLAARLQALAAPGTILVSESTHRLVRGFFRVRPAGPLEVKGKTDPVTAYEMLGETDAATPMTIAEARGLTPFVGRANELAQLNACFDLLAADLPQVVAVVGEAGSGKSRLLYEFRQQLAGREAVFFEARCSSMTQSLPYAPFIGMLRQFFELTVEESAGCSCDKIAARIAALGAPVEDTYPFICRMLSLPADLSGDRPADEVRRQTFEAIAELVMATTRQSPVVMVIEDLHWIDESSREMLELAVASMHHAPLMLVVSHRPDYRPAWRAQVAFTQLNLRRLDDAESIEIVRSIVGGPLPDGLERAILAKAEGNPFFLEEMTRALVEEGYVIRGDRHVRLTRPIEQIRIPDTVQELIGARLDRLGPAAKRVVQVASVFGRQFHRTDLGRLFEGEGIDVAALLDELERRGVVHRKTVLSSDEFRFGESLTQEVAYGSLLLKERRQLHERVAVLLEGHPGERGADHSALLAHHFSRSDNRLRAVQALVQAAVDAEKLPSFRSAAEFYRGAWELAEPLVAAAAPADPAVVKAAIAAAIGLSRMGVIYGASDILVTERIAPRAFEIAQASGDVDSAVTLRVLHGLAMAGAEREKFQQGIALVEEALRIAEGSGRPAAFVTILRGLAWAYVLDGRFDVAAGMVERMLSTVAQIGERDRLGDVYFGALFLRNGLRYYSDDIAGAFTGARETYDLALRASNRTVQSGSASWLAAGHFARGEYREAKEWADLGLGIAERIGNSSALRAAAAIALGARVELGEAPETDRLLPLLEQGYAAKGDMALKSYLVIDVLLSLGEIERAQRFAELAIPYAGGRLREIMVNLALAEVLRQLGPERWNEAERLYRHAATLGQEIGSRSTVAAASLGLAELAAARGDRESAGIEARKALAVYQELDLGRYVTRTEHLLAKLAAAA